MMAVQCFIWTVVVVFLALLTPPVALQDSVIGFNRPPPPQFPDFVEFFQESFSAIGDVEARKILDAVVSQCDNDTSVSPALACCALKVNFSDFNQRLNSSNPVDLNEVCYPPTTTTAVVTTTLQKTTTLSTTTATTARQVVSTLRSTDAASLSTPSSNNSSQSKPTSSGPSLSSTHSVSASSKSTPGAPPIGVNSGTTSNLPPSMPPLETTAYLTMETPRIKPDLQPTSAPPHGDRMWILGPILGVILPVLLLIAAIVGIAVYCRRSRYPQGTCIGLILRVFKVCRTQRTDDAQCPPPPNNTTALPGRWTLAGNRQTNRQESTASDRVLISRTNSVMSDGSPEAYPKATFRLPTIGETSTDNVREPVTDNQTLPRCGQPPRTAPDVIGRSTDPTQRRHIVRQASPPQPSRSLSKSSDLIRLDSYYDDGRQFSSNFARQNPAYEPEVLIASGGEIQSNQMEPDEFVIAQKNALLQVNMINEFDDLISDDDQGPAAADSSHSSAHDLNLGFGTNNVSPLKPFVTPNTSMSVVVENGPFERNCDVRQSDAGEII